MKKLILVFVYALFLINIIYSQARVNAELAIVTDTGRELTETRGWSTDEAGQWRSSKNRIIYTFQHTGVTDFEKLKLCNVVFNNVNYLLFEIMIRDVGFEFIHIPSSRYEYRTRCVH